MSRVETTCPPRGSRPPWGLAWLAALALAGCAAGPSQEAGTPRLRTQAQGMERSAQRHHVQGDYAAAAQQFGEAARLYQSIDNPGAAARSRLWQAQAELAQGQAEQALAHANEVKDASLEVPALLLRVQANLTLGRVDVARPLLGRLAPLCSSSSCAERGSYWLLRSRLAWIDGLVNVALADAEAAVPVLRAQGETRELANAWRLIAAARLQVGDSRAALEAAQAALEIDRQQALPEKIARDWLLIGDILHRAGKPEARTAYRRASAVAEAAGLTELAQLAGRALTEESR